MGKVVLSIDIGGTNIKYGLVTESGEILSEYSTKTKIFSTVNDLSQHLKDFFVNNNQFDSIDGIGIGAPNGNYYSGTIDNAPNLPWKGEVLIRKVFENDFHKKTVISNDANATAIGEKLFGKGKDYKNFVLITIGTGLGSGIVSNNQLIIGANSLAGEFGHIRVINEGRVCNCGRNGCLERYASATGIVETYYELRSQFPTSILYDNQEVTTKEIFKAYNEQDALAVEIINQTVKVLGNALADFACFSDPEAYILFGGIFRTESDFIDKLKVEMEKNILSIYKNKIEVKKSGLDREKAALLGATAIFLDDVAN